MLDCTFEQLSAICLEKREFSSKLELWTNPLFFQDHQVEKSIDIDLLESFVKQYIGCGNKFNFNGGSIFSTQFNNINKATSTLNLIDHTFRQSVISLVKQVNSLRIDQKNLTVVSSIISGPQCLNSCKTKNGKLKSYNCAKICVLIDGKNFVIEHHPDHKFPFFVQYSPNLNFKKSGLIFQGRTLEIAFRKIFCRLELNSYISVSDNSKIIKNAVICNHRLFRNSSISIFRYLDQISNNFTVPMDLQYILTHTKLQISIEQLYEFFAFLVKHNTSIVFHSRATINLQRIEDKILILLDIYSKLLEFEALNPVFSISFEKFKNNDNSQTARVVTLTSSNVAETINIVLLNGENKSIDEVLYLKSDCFESNLLVPNSSVFYKDMNECLKSSDINYDKKITIKHSQIPVAA